MRVVLQRVTRASVGVEGEPVASIGRGMLLLVGVGRGDSPGEAARLAGKIATLRVFADDEGKTNRDITDAGGEALVVSQFTLFGDVSKGRRPSWAAAEDPPVAEERVEAFAAALESHGIVVSRGRFGADMAVELVNDGPFTLVLETRAD